MQQVWAGVGDRVTRLELPDPEVAVVPGVLWGRPEVPMTPAYWAVRCRWADDDELFISKTGSLVEEVAFCLLGGFGITYEVNAAAYAHLKSLGAFESDREPEEAWLLAELSQPLQVGARSIRYRFPRQRARRLARMSDQLRDIQVEDFDALQLRDRLLRIEGVGPKTASWIVRNLLGSDDVAILDVHVLRACRAMSVFPSEVRLPKDYNVLESLFISFAKAIDVRASLLDAVMWLEMRGGAANLR
jgi:thermostable 8-oxoguanine DNA glycosylase